MITFGTFARLSILFLGCLILVSCNQSSGKKSAIDTVLTADARSEKIKAARKRAAKARIEQKKAFEKNRQEQRESRTASLKKKSGKRTKEAKTARKNKKKIAKRLTVKGTRYAYVGGRSRGISKKAPWRCVPKRLKIVLNQVSKKFGKVIINSTHRSRGHNRRVGGKRRSYHLRCQAVDFRVQGRNRGLTRWLARHPYVGGYKRYRSGFYHIDTGPKRTW